MTTQPTKLNHGITVVDANYIQADIACTYLIESQGQISIVETGTSLSVPGILSAIEAAGLTANDVAYVIPTHIHLDHAGGVGELLKQCPHAKLVIHPRGAPHMIDPSRLEAGTIAVYGEEKFRKLYGELIPVAADKIIEAPDGFVLDFNGRELHFIDTPGHATHHFCIHDPLSKGIFSGDTFGLSYRGLDTPKGPFIFATTTPVQFDPEAMYASIDKLLALKPELMYLTHFGAIKPTPEIINQLKKSIAAFVEIAHQEQDSGQSRVQNINQKITAWLLSELQLMGGEKSESYYKSIIKGDSNLNSQGLDIWLKRLEKQRH